MNSEKRNFRSIEQKSLVCLNFDSIVISFAKKNSEATRHKSIFSLKFRLIMVKSKMHTAVKVVSRACFMVDIEQVGQKTGFLSKRITIEPLLSSYDPHVRLSPFISAVKCLINFPSSAGFVRAECKVPFDSTYTREIYG